MRWTIVLISLVGGVALLFVNWRGKTGGALNVLGSTSIQPFAEMLAEDFNRQGHGFIVDVQGGGSTAGLQAAAEGIADIGMCSRGLKDNEKQRFREVVIAWDGLAVVVHPGNPVSDIRLDEARRLFAGEITNWRELGGQDRPVRLITREEGSGTREAFTKLVMGGRRISRKALTQESNGAVKELVRHDPCAVGYMSLGLVGELKALKVDGEAATAEAVTSKRYKLVRPFLFVSKGELSEKAKGFIAYVLSPEGQKLLTQEGLVKVQ